MWKEHLHLHLNSQSQSRLHTILVCRWGGGGGGCRKGEGVTRPTSRVQQVPILSWGRGDRTLKCGWGSVLSKDPLVPGNPPTFQDRLLPDPLSGAVLPSIELTPQQDGPGVLERAQATKCFHGFTQREERSPAPGSAQPREQAGDWSDAPHSGSFHVSSSIPIRVHVFELLPSPRYRTQRAMCLSGLAHPSRGAFPGNP